MKSKLTAALALGVFSAVFAGVLAGDIEVGKRPPRPFAVVFIVDTPERGDKTSGNSKPSKAGIKKLQAEIASDPALVRKLEARGISVRRIVRREALDGKQVFYVQRKFGNSLL